MDDTRFDVTTLGETMLRLSVPAGTRLESAAQLDLYVGGAESNVASALARLGRRCAWMGSLPDNPLGHRAANEMRQAGIDLQHVVWNRDGRMGLYFAEFAVPPRPIHVTYDRAHSCGALLKPEQVHWEKLLHTRVLHLTGITPPLSANALEIVRLAVERAHAANVPVSFDINYRQKLWTTAQAANVLRELIQNVTLLFCSRADAQRVFGLNGTAEELIQQLHTLSHARNVVLTLQADGVIAFDGNNILRAPALPVHIIDRLGAGDALAAGVLHGWLDGNLAQGLRYGTAMAALALSQHGDMVVTNANELEQLLKNENALVR